MEPITIIDLPHGHIGVPGAVGHKRGQLVAVKLDTREARALPFMAGGERFAMAFVPLGWELGVVRKFMETFAF